MNVSTYISRYEYNSLMVNPKPPVFYGSLTRFENCWINTTLVIDINLFQAPCLACPKKPSCAHVVMAMFSLLETQCSL